MARKPTYSAEDWRRERDEILATMTRDAIRTEARALGSGCHRCKTKRDYAGNLATFRLEVRDGKVGEWVSQAHELPPPVASFCNGGLTIHEVFGCPQCGATVMVKGTKCLDCARKEG